MKLEEDVMSQTHDEPADQGEQQLVVFYEIGAEGNSALVSVVYQSGEFFDGQPGSFNLGFEQANADGFACMDRNREKIRASFLFQDVVAALGADKDEARLLERLHGLLAADLRNASYEL